MAYTYNDDDMDQNADAEKRLIEGAQGGKEFGKSVGNAAGTIGGVGIGAAATALTGGAALPLAPVIAGAGGLIGGLIGEGIGGWDAHNAEQELSASVQKKTEEDRRNLVRSAAIRQLGGDWLPRVRGL